MGGTEWSKRKKGKSKGTGCWSSEAEFGADNTSLCLGLSWESSAHALISWMIVLLRRDIVLVNLWIVIQLNDFCHGTLCWKLLPAGVRRKE